MIQIVSVDSFFSEWPNFRRPAESWAGPVTFHPNKYTEIAKFEKTSSSMPRSRFRFISKFGS